MWETQFHEDNILSTIGIWGELAGLVLIALVSFWDFIVIGGRGFFEYAIAWKGILAIWVGLGLIVASKHLDKTEW